MIDLIPYYLFKSLLITLIVEVGCALILKDTFKKDYLNIVLVNIFTNLLLNSILIGIGIFYGQNTWLFWLIILETIVFIFEGFVYKKVLIYQKWNPYVFSIILNMSSFLIGMIINRL